MSSIPISNTTASHTEIKVLQLSYNRKPTATHGLLNEQLDKADILLLQKPQWAKISPDRKKGPIGHNAWTPILPFNTYKPGDPEPRVMAYVQHRPGLEIALRSDIIQDHDVQILTASFRGHPTTMIINMYNDKDHKNDRASKIICQLLLALDHPTIITGDWNMYHLLWAN